MRYNVFVTNFILKQTSLNRDTTFYHFIAYILSPWNNVVR